MLGSQPVRVVMVSNQWLDVLDIASGDELASVALDAEIELDGDLLFVGGLSIHVDRSYLSEAQSLVKVAARITSKQRPSSVGNRQVFCTQCGSPVDSSAKFCTGCGSALSKRADRNLGPGQGDVGHVDDFVHAQDSQLAPPIDFELGRAEARQPMSATGRRNLVFVIAVVIVVAVVVVVARGGGDSRSSSTIENISGSSACRTLSSYAYNGIPATYIDDGAQLLYSLSEEFSSLGRGDIAGLVNEVVDLTYQGPGGQLSAKNLLIDTASTYC